MLLKCQMLLTGHPSWATSPVLPRQHTAEPASTISSGLEEKYVQRAENQNHKGPKPLIPPSGCLIAQCKFLQEVAKPLRTNKL